MAKEISAYYQLFDHDFLRSVPVSYDYDGCGELENISLCKRKSKLCMHRNIRLDLNTVMNLSLDQGTMQ